ncbi:fimbrial protein [Proteus faecis]|uniref:fimbrial protein n=1 Tax=Proteus faecis TaxID=2050967 RepID=UPI00257AA149|nr:fimbrial protein [Proteus faecis]MDM3869177.1 fimbrial protein [Proteus faecis]
MNLSFLNHHHVNALFLWGLTLFSATAQSAKDYNVYIHGTLVAEPCDLVMEDRSLTVEFGTIIDRYLYINNRTHPKEFRIHLMNCELEEGDGVRIGFIGAENPNLPGFLALDNGSSATHIGIGLQDNKGHFLPINKQTPYYPLHNGSNTLIFHGYVEAEREAIVNRNVGLGSFAATAVFLLDYD